MARNEADHEDLMRDAVSLIRRVEIRYSGRPEPALVGCNASGWLFVYLGSDPMYRFDELGRLRRAFVDGKLFRTSGRTLAVLDRHKSSAAGIGEKSAVSTLLRRDLLPIELAAFRDRMRKELDELCEGLRHAEILRQHPPDIGGLAEEFQASLRGVLASTEFLAPAIVIR